MTNNQLPLFPIILTSLEYRVLELSYKLKLSHLSSNLTSVNIIDDIFKNKSPDDKFFLSQGHAGLALYCIIEKYHNLDAEKLYAQNGVHPRKDLSKFINCTAGSLGLVELIAAGHAMADRNKNIYVLCSDGGISEGSFWETLYFRKKNKLNNLKIIINTNGYSAYDSVNIQELEEDISGFNYDNGIKIIKTDNRHYPFLGGLESHYKTLSESDWKLIQEIKNK